MIGVMDYLRLRADSATASGESVQARLRKAGA